MDRSVDVVVAGAGPAGCSAAICLARAGVRVLLADAAPTRPPRLPVAETLPAVATRALAALGLDPAGLLATGAVPAAGTSSLWGSQRPVVRSSVFDPDGPGYQLDRPRFDAWLRDEAERAGARLVGHRLARVEPYAVGIVVGDRGGRHWTRCRWVIDATGRAARVSRALGAVRRRDDLLVARYAALPRGDGDTDAHTMIEAMPSGWWYSGPAGRQRVVAYLTDADLQRPGLRDPRGFAAALLETTHVRPDRTTIPQTCPAGTAANGAFLAPSFGRRWAAVGDAAVAFDPLSSQGLLNALVTGSAAAQAVASALRDSGDRGLTEYAAMLQRVWDTYRANRLDAYLAEQRWPGEPFWQRRHRLSS